MMERLAEQRGSRRFAPPRAVWVVLLVVGALVAAVAVSVGRQGGSPAAADGGSQGGSQAQVVKTFVFGGEITSNGDTTSLPITNWPPSEAIASYKVPSTSRLVIESAYVS